MSSSPGRVAVIGGGISGLATAYFLEKGSSNPPDIDLFEATPRLGGKIQTSVLDGFVWEAGPDSFLVQKPAGLQLCKDLGLQEQVMTPQEQFQGTFILRDGKLLPFPEGLLSLIPTRAWPILTSPLLSLAGKIRLLREPFIPKRDDPSEESLGSFLRRRFGDPFFERFASPVLSGIFSGDPDGLALEATLPNLAELERQYGSVVVGLKKRIPLRRSVGSASPFRTLSGGMGMLVEALEASLVKTKVHRGAWIDRIERAKQDWILIGPERPPHYQALFLATGPGPAASLLDACAPEASSALRSFPSGSSATVSFGWKPSQVPNPPPGHGFVVTPGSGPTFSACTWLSQKWAHRAPPKAFAARVFFGERNAKQWRGLSEDALGHLAEKELRTLFDLPAPHFRRAALWTDNMPVFSLGHRDRLERTRLALAELPGLFCCGSVFRRSGIPDCIEDAREQAKTFLRAKRN